ncbi:MAG: FlgD immunoglobulin-like domain containing protein, partial [Candidatus Cloacimonadota bacterium]|nr:FlgD immunoglobulin-like domain containing protein [Candidatus Cloacimonadota bacterium]
VYIAEPSTQAMIIRVWDDDEGLPNSQLVQLVYPAASFVQGWNNIEFPDGNQVSVSDGSFYIGIFEVAGSSAIGLDTNSTSGNSFINDGGWVAMTEGNLMIRAILDGIVGNDTDSVNPEVLNVTNYPNPFNPTTTIALNMPKAGNAEISIINIKGQIVKTIVNQELDKGQHSFKWNGFDNNDNSVASGVYFYKVETANKTVTNRMLLLK